MVCTTDGFAVGGTLVGLSGSVTLQNNGGDDTVVGADEPFAFSTHAASGTAYAVTVLTQPAGSNCVVSGGTGTVGAGDVQSITVNCASDLFTIGGNVSRPQRRHADPRELRWQRAHAHRQRQLRVLHAGGHDHRL